MRASGGWPLAAERSWFAQPSPISAGGGIRGFAIGQRLDGVDRFQGRLDEVRIWPRALSLEELRQVRESNAAPPSAVLRLQLEAITPS